MTDAERAALAQVVEGVDGTPYDMLLRLEAMGLVEFVADDLGGDFYPTDKGRKALEDAP